MRISRRQFLKASLVQFTGITLGGGLPLSYLYARNAAAPVGNTRMNTPRVCIVRNPQSIIGGKPNISVIREMLNKGAMTLSGQSQPHSAWQTYFSRKDKIALKVNPVARQTGSTRPELCYALIETLTDNMDMPPDRFIIFDVDANDLAGAGFPPGAEKDKPRIVASPSYSPWIQKGSFKTRLSQILTTGCTALVNMPLLKTHKSAGISVALKNHYGSIPKTVVRQDALRYHDDQFKNLVHLNSLPLIQDKTRLVVVDALIGQYHRGPHGDPRYQWPFSGIIMGTDPVAIDTVSLEVINQKRRDNALDPIRLPYLDWAREEGIGTNAANEIDVIEIIV